MAEEVTIIVDVEVDNQQAQRNLEETTRRIEILKKERTALNTAIKKGNGITKEQAQSLTAVTQALKRETEEQKKYNKQVNTTSNSLNAMRSRLIANKKALGDINQSTRAGALRFKRLSKETDILSSKITKQEKGYGVATRSVGKYSEATDGLSAVFPQLGGGLTQATTAMRAFTASLLLNPIFLIIAAVIALGAALSQFFTRTQRGVEKWEIIQATFNATLNVTLDRLADFGEAIFDLAELLDKKPSEAIANLGDLILNNLTNRFKGFIDIIRSGGGIIADGFFLMAEKIKLAFADVPILGKAVDVEETEKRIEDLTKNIEEGFANMSESTTQALTGVDNLFAKIAESIKSVNEEITEEVRLTTELTKRKQGLEKEEVKFIITQQRRIKQIAELRLKGKEESREAEERIGFLEKAQKLEEKNLQQAIKFKERTIALGLINNDNITTEAEAISRINQLLSNGRAIKIDEIGLAKSTLEDQKKLNESVAELDALRTASFRKQKLLETELTTLRNKAVKEESDIAQGTSVKSPLVEKLRKEFEIETKAAERLRVFREEQRIQELTDLDEKLLSEQELILSQSQFKIDNAELTASEIALIEEESAAKQLALFERNAEAEEALDQRVQDNKIQLASGALGAIAGLFEQESREYKILASAQAVIDTYAAANRAYLSQLSIPTPDAPVRAGIAAGVAVTVGLANVAKINGVKFEQGGLVKGASHNQGGIQMYQRGTGQHLGEMQGEEYIFSAESTKAIGVDTLDAMNFGSSAPMSTGHFANGGQVSTSTRSATAIDQSQMQFQQMIRAVGMMPNPVVSVSEISSVSSNVMVKEQLGL